MIYLDILPQQQIQSHFDARLFAPSELSLKQLEHQLPAVYYAIVSLWLAQADFSVNALQQLSTNNIISDIPHHHIGWQQLRLANHQHDTSPEPIVAQVVVLIKYKQLHLLYLRLLPKSWRLEAHNDLPQAKKRFQQLLAIVLSKLADFGRKNRCELLVSDIYNPILKGFFKDNGFVPLDVHQRPNPMMASTLMCRAL